MENTCLQYENSLTRQAEESMDIWTKELADMSERSDGCCQEPERCQKSLYSRIFDEKADTGIFF